MHVMLKIRFVEGFMCVTHKCSKYIVQGTKAENAMSWNDS